MGDAQGVLGEGVQGSTGIIEFESLFTGVSDGHSNLQILQSIDLGVRDRRLDCQARGGRASDRRGDEGNEGSTLRREHSGEGSGGG